jgi:hypothetical protein
MRAPERPVGTEGDGAEARIRSRRWRRLVRGTLMVLAQAAGTLLVLGVLSGTARADVASSHGVEAPEQPPAPHDVRVGPPGQVVGAGATIDGAGAGATVSVPVAASRASVSGDETGISLSLEPTHVPEPVDETPPNDGPHRLPAIFVGDRRTPPPSSNGGDRRATSTRADWFSISAAAGQHGGVANSSARHPLGRQLHALAATAGAAASSTDDRPDVLGLLAHWSLKHDSDRRPFRPVITVFTSELIASTGPPG